MEYSALGGNIALSNCPLFCLEKKKFTTGAHCVNAELSGHKSVMTCQIMLGNGSIQLLFGSSEPIFVVFMVLDLEEY